MGKKQKMLKFLKIFVYLGIGIALQIIFLFIISGGVGMLFEITHSKLLSTDIIKFKSSVENIIKISMPLIIISSAILSNISLIFLGRKQLQCTVLNIREFLNINKLFIDKKLIFIVTLFAMGLSLVLSEIMGIVINIFKIDISSLDKINNILGSFSGLIYVILLAPILEEIIFRGIILRSLKKSFKFSTSIYISSFFFALYHMNFIKFIPIFILGYFLGYIYKKTNSLGVVIYFHMIYNLIPVAITVFRKYYNISRSYDYTLNDIAVLLFGVLLITWGVGLKKLNYIK
ncbi:CPBP family intramembrane glutamic endopeptidase [Haliovirga abyssi]|uniref:CAAX prenyl protease 2/Lysostaphin resistance protein A-like domain-containing protein n=1 Tax=Haliovirga abyssi TaxID=2996794 RepID=A0AAU9DGW8_9FUSO|nr:CPBP family intramembrane glutamic endopeptidase [Haliovirga abyssi]BDU51533.1 hypothetical protein HLVA_21020 [Haliovirga abyssi]